MSSTQITAGKAILSPIETNDLDDVAGFLHHHMNDRFTPQEWKQGISKSWLPDAPNYGFILKNNTQIVGVLCAIYSVQNIEGNLRRFCNPHSWCVLSDFRARSIDLVLALIRQKDYTFTMFSPNKEGVEIFKYLKFKPLNDELLMFLNVPSVSGSGKVVNHQDIEQVVMHLPHHVAQHYTDHADFPWLNFLFFREKDQYGFLIYKKQHYKRLASAWIMYISDTGLFSRCWPSIRTHLLFKHGFFTSKIEARLLDHPIRTRLRPLPGHQKFYMSEELSADSIQNLYSELVTLDL